MKILKTPFKLNLFIAFVLLTASVAYSSVNLNIDLSPMDGGASTKISWLLSGDIVSPSGVKVISPDPAVYSLYPAGSLFNTFNTVPFINISGGGLGLFSDSFRTALTNTQWGSEAFINVISGGSTLTRNDSLLFKNTLTSIKFSVKDNTDILSLGGAVSGTGNLLGESSFLWLSLQVVNGDTVKYIPNGNDTTIIPLAFSSFNSGIYSDTSNSFIDTSLYSYVLQTDVVTTVTVASVPEPSQVEASLMLAAGIAGFVIVRRRKTV